MVEYTGKGSNVHHGKEGGTRDPASTAVEAPPARRELYAGAGCF